MNFTGYKLTFDCTNWKQVEAIGDFWDFVAQFVPREKIVGLGWNWNNINTNFTYALGTINDATTLNQLSKINFESSPFHPDLITLKLPPESDWKTFLGKVDDLQKIYETAIDPLGEKDYELEYIDNSGNLKILVHLS